MPSTSVSARTAFAACAEKFSRCSNAVGRGRGRAGRRRAVGRATFQECRYEVARLGRSDLLRGSRWKQATAPSRARFCGACAVRKFLAKCPCPRCSVMLPCSCADDVEVLRQVRQKTTTMFKTITSAKALSVAHESVEQRGERAQRGQHLRLDARVVLDELRSSSCRPPLNFSCVFSRGVRRRVHGRSAASACAACAACAAVSGVGGESAAVGGRLVERRRRRQEVLRSSEFGVVPRSLAAPQ